MAEHTPVVALQAVQKVYSTGKLEVHALQGIDLEIEAGECVSIMGPSGSGKATLLEILGCLDSQTGNEIMSILHAVHTEGATVLIVTHDPSIGEQAKRPLSIRDGCIECDRLRE